MNIKVSSIIALLTIIDSDVYIFIKDDELIDIPCFDELDIVNKEYINKLKISNVDLKQCYTFSEKREGILYISTLFVDIIDSFYINIKNELKLIKLSDLSNEKYKKKIMEFLKNELSKIDSIKKIYKDEFSLPEIQKLYENLFNKKFDRRNFRKKLIKSNLVDCLDKKTSKNGRPAKLYKFKNLDSSSLF